MKNLFGLLMNHYFNCNTFIIVMQRCLLSKITFLKKTFNQMKKMNNPIGMKRKTSRTTKYYKEQ